MSNAVIIEEADRNVIVRFNRPEIRSPLSISVLETVAAIVDDIERRDYIGRMIFTGVGTVFASGADLREIAEVDAETAREFALRGQNLMKRISELNAATIAAVNGICFGGALDLALACDRRIASPQAMFSHPGADLGIMTGWGGTQRLSRLVGEAVSLEMFFTAKRVNSNEAMLIGLVDEVADDPLARALSSVQ
jgi:enoyl-CoA hydratase